jgi:cold shock CspA family protein
MTGKITQWRPEGRRGLIQTEDGQKVMFAEEAVWPYDVSQLGVGQMVSFELKGNKAPQASNVRRQESQAVSATSKSTHAAGHLQYVGFSQDANIREYRFELRVPGQQLERLEVCMDLGLLLKHSIRIQEGPSLCWKVLASGLEWRGQSSRPTTKYILSEADIATHLRVQALALSKLPPKRPHQKAAVVGVEAAETNV